MKLTTCTVGATPLEGAAPLAGGRPLGIAEAAGNKEMPQGKGAMPGRLYRANWRSSWVKALRQSVFLRHPSTRCHELVAQGATPVYLFGADLGSDNLVD